MYYVEVVLTKRLTVLVLKKYIVRNEKISIIHIKYLILSHSGLSQTTVSVIKVLFIVIQLKSMYVTDVLVLGQ